MTRPRNFRMAFSNTSGCFANGRRREALEAHAAGLRAVVVAPDAVLVNRGELRLRRSRSGDWPAGAALNTPVSETTSAPSQRNDRDQCDSIPFHMSHRRLRIR